MPRVILDHDPFLKPATPFWCGRYDWPASWVDHPERPQLASSVALFRRQFTAVDAATVRIHLSADNRYRLFLDGEPIGRGPERGDPGHWRYESYDLELSPGVHTLLVQSWWLIPDEAPFAQMSVRSGMILSADGIWDEQLSTGVASWEAMLLSGFTFLAPGQAWGTGANVEIDGTVYPWGWECGEIGTWIPVVEVARGTNGEDGMPHWQLTPATLPGMREARLTIGVVRHLDDAPHDAVVEPARHWGVEADAWQRCLAGAGTVTIPPHTARRAIIDLQNYYCAYPELRVCGGTGGLVTLYWAESLFTAAKPDAPKGHRDAIAGKFFVSDAGDRFRPDGGAHRVFSPLWWQAGRYLMLTVTTGEEPLTLEALALQETRYPLDPTATFDASDARLAACVRPMVRVLQLCSHETYMDCPYYEQLMYIGDTRLEALATYTLTQDDRLPRKALRCFDASRRVSGVTQSRYPSKWVQIIPPFSLWWVGMVHDYWQWRDDPAFVRTLLPGVRQVMEYFRTLVDAEGLMHQPEGWNFVDWAVKWHQYPHYGAAPKGEQEPSSVLTLQCILALQAKADMEAALGEGNLAARDRALAERLFRTVLARFWNAERGLLADTLDQHEHYSEHAQVLAILTGLLPTGYAGRVAHGLLAAPDLARTTIYFSHYLFEALYRLGRTDRMLERMDLWFGLRDLGLMTTPEHPEPVRSDCHAWGAHPLYHYYATLLGIRPATPGFRQVHIAPALGSLAWAEGTMAHPAGEVHARVERNGTGVSARIILPPGVSGTFVWAGEEQPLTAGENSIIC